jgi:hypothetical protein
LFDYIAYVLSLELFDFACDEAFVATIDGFDFDAIVDGGTSDSAHCGIHSWSITARGEHSDAV